MKNKILYILLPAFLFIYVSCNKISESLQRDAVIIDTVSFEIPIIANIADTITISKIESPININEQVNAQIQDLSIDNLTSVKVSSIDLGLVSGESVDTVNNFNILQTIRLQIADGIKTDSLASINITSGSTSTLALTPVILPETLKPYLSGPSLFYNVTIKAKGVTTAVMKVKARAVYNISLTK